MKTPLLLSLVSLSLCAAEFPVPYNSERDDGKPMPASYLNFYLGNRAVVVPLYETRQDAAALETIAALFPGRRTAGGG